MKKAQPPIKAELDPGATTDSISTNDRKFKGTSNPRHVRVLRALVLRTKLAREEVDRIAGASNGPQIIAELRRLGLDVPCIRGPATDRDGIVVYPGIYSLSERDRREVIRVLFS